MVKGTEASQVARTGHTTVQTTRAEFVRMVDLATLGCSTASTPATNPDPVRHHADKAFQQLKAQEPSQQPGDRPASPQASAPTRE